MAHLHDIVFDSAHPASAARFWAATLDEYSVAPYDEAELLRLRSLGFTGPEDDPTVLVEPVSGRGPRLWFQLVPEEKRVKNRVHLDIRTADLETETARLTELGASVIARHDDHTVFADPEGNEFCLFLITS